MDILLKNQGVKNQVFKNFWFEWSSILIEGFWSKY